MAGSSPSCWIIGSRRRLRPSAQSTGPRRLACTPQAVRDEGLAARLPGHAAGSFHGTGAGHAGRRRARRRSQRRLPPAHARKLHSLVQGGAHPAGTAGRGRLRAAGVLPRAHPRGAPGGQPGLLPDGRQPGHPPAASRPGWWTAPPGIVCDAKSGVSGAGRKPSLKTSFCEVTENFSAYSILNHRHVPEVLLISGLEEREFSFTAQLLPLDRGILETIYFRAHGVASAEDLLGIYESRYAGEPFVRLYQPGPRARPARRGAHQFLRHRRHARRGAPGAPWWSAPSTTW